jgi:ABC-type phosphate/phosphonate transport system substrate-binding protein
LFISLLAIFIVACTPPPPPQALPTRVPSTPFSTELAPVPTSIPAGFNADNPIQIVIVPADFEAATGRESELQDLLEELTDDVVMQVVFVETQPEALGLLCASDVGTVSAAWMSGFAYAGAEASQCGIPTLQIDHNTDGASDTGESGVILLRVEFSELGLEGLLASDEPVDPENEITIERRFCRTSIDDLFSWTIPLMALNAEGIRIDALEDVQEFEDYDTMLQAMIDGDCAVIGLPLSVWEELDDAGAISDDTVNVVETSPEFPYDVMVFPFAAALEVIEPITDALLTIDVAAGRAEAEASEAEGTPEPIDINVDSELMDLLFGDGHFIRVQASDFGEMVNFINSSGLDLGQLGQ